MTNPPARKKKLKWLVAALLALSAGVASVALWFSGVTFSPGDQIFRGKPETEWIKNLAYNNDKQVKEWRGYGEEGVQVLIRGLRRTERPGERAYRQLYHKVAGVAGRFLPAPKSDSTYSQRMALVSLLASLGDNAKSAIPIMMRTVSKDEADGVRQCAINFFNSSEDEKCVLNQLPPDLKKRLLPAFLRDAQNASNWGLRNNAVLALKWYPQERAVIAPVLTKLLLDPQPQVRLLAATTLNKVDPDAAKKARAVDVAVEVLKNPDDQIAYRAAEALKSFKNEPATAVHALVEGLDNTNSLVACQCVWSLEWSPPEFKPYADVIIPALQRIAERTNNVGGYAKTALKNSAGTLAVKAGLN